MDIAAIGTALTAVRGLTDIARNLAEVRDIAKLTGLQAEMNTRLLDLQQALFDARAALDAKAEEITQLKAANAELERKASERERYLLFEVRPGAFVYALRNGVQPPEPSHHVCQLCFDKGVKAILERQESRGAGTRLWCPACARYITLEPPAPLPPPAGGSWMAA